MTSRTSRMRSCGRLQQIDRHCTQTRTAARPTLRVGRFPTSRSLVEVDVDEERDAGGGERKAEYSSGGFASKCATEEQRGCREGEDTRSGVLPADRERFEWNVDEERVGVGRGPVEDGVPGQWPDERGCQRGDDHDRCAFAAYEDE